MTSETYPKHLSEIGVPEAERDIRDMQPFRGRFTLWIVTTLCLWWLAICLCSAFCLLSKEINSEQKINTIKSQELCKIQSSSTQSFSNSVFRQKLLLSFYEKKQRKMLSMFKML